MTDSDSDDSNGMHTVGQRLATDLVEEPVRQVPHSNSADAAVRNHMTRHNVCNPTLMAVLSGLRRKSV